MGPSSLEQRVGILAVALAMEAGGNGDDARARELVRVADGNRTAMYRAMGRLEKGPGGPGPSGNVPLAS